MRLAIVCIVIILAALTSSNHRSDEQLITQQAFAYDNLDKADQHQVDCLANNMYFEARNQGPVGMVAVAYVTINRAMSGVFPDTVCAVVKQKTASTTCQFTWWCNAKLRAQAINRSFNEQEHQLYLAIRQLATRVYVNRSTPDVTQGATFYHATYVKPRWKGVEKTVTIGDHVFYKRSANAQPTQNTRRFIVAAAGSASSAADERVHQYN